MLEASRAVLLWCACASLGCGSALPAPDPARHPRGVFVEVPYPPPAALAELVPAFDHDRAVWLDGYWSWRGRKYAWLRGGWVLPASGARFAPWQLEYRADGKLWFAEGAWYDRSFRRLREPETLMPARTPANEVTPEDANSH